MTEILTFLKQSDIFYQFTQTQLELVANLCVEKTFQAGELIFAENNSGKELYIIVQGEVNISVNPGVVGTEGKSEKTVIATLRRGQSFHPFIFSGLPCQTAAAYLLYHLY